MNTSKKLHYMVKLALLVALILVMQATGLGLISFGVIQITTLVIPVAVGAIVLGSSAGAILGAAFGAMVLWECFFPKTPFAFGAMLLQINPVMTGILCIVPRALCGWVAGMIFKALKKVDRTKFVRHAIASISCALLNTLLFLVGVVLVFGQTEYIQSVWSAIAPGANVIVFAAVLVGINALVEILSCGIVGAAVARALDRE